MYKIVLENVNGVKNVKGAGSFKISLRVELYTHNFTFN